MKWVEAVVLVSMIECGAALSSGCGGAATPPPTLATAEADIRTAHELGAQSDPQGALHLKLAQEELANAKKLYNDGDAKNGDLVLGMASVDAELALAEAREAQSRAQTQQVIDQVKLIKAQR